MKITPMAQERPMSLKIKKQKKEKKRWLILMNLYQKKKKEHSI